MKKHALFLSAWLALPGLLSDVDAAPTVFTFSDPASPLEAASGPGTLEYFDPDGSDWGPVETQFGKASAFGVPAIDGVDPDVMSIPGCTRQQGYLFTHGAEPNGAYGEGMLDLVSNYTFVFDVFYPNSSGGAYRALWQTDLSNGSDADFFIHDTTSGIGISSRYLGTVTTGAWHRIVVAIRTGTGEGQAHRYIDGRFVGTTETTGAGLNERWGLESEVLLFTDEDNETRPAFVSSVSFVDRTLTYEEVLALGGPNAAGAHVPGTPAAPEEKMLRRVEAIGHRGGAFGYAPDNTVSAITKAFAEGAAGVEIDTRLTSDGVAVCFHDDTLERTTDGFGFVSDLKLADLKELDAGSKFDPAFAGEKIPTVAEALTAAKGKGIVYLDIKTEGQADALAEAIEEAAFPVEDIWFWAPNDPDYPAEIRVADIRDAVPNAKILWGSPASTWASDPDYFSNLRELGVVGFSIGTQAPNAAFCARAKAEGMIVEIYTVNTPGVMRAAAIAGVDYIETDFPALLAALQPTPDTTASAPLPADGSLVLTETAVLRWTVGQNATLHRVHFGTVDPPPFIAEQAEDFYETPALAESTTYYWRVDEITPSGTVTGDVWRFSTPSPDLGTVFEWNFAGDLAPSLGEGVLEFANGEATEEQVAWETSDGNLVPHPDGSPVSYLRLPGFSDAADGLALTLTDIPGNGGGGDVNIYSFVFDVLVPAGWEWVAFFNTAPSNTNDSDFFVDSNGLLGIADLGYSPAGTIQPETWHRVVWTAHLPEGVVTYYVDGEQVFQRAGSSLTGGRFSLYSGATAGPHVRLFGDNSGETWEMLVSAFAFVDSMLTRSQVAALGGVKAEGIFPQTPPVELPPLTVSGDGSTLTLTWAGAANRYLQRSTALAANSWSKIESTEGQSTHSEAIVPGGLIFFRLAQD